MLLLVLMILPAVQGVEKVKVELYSESLCPYCANFIINYLNPFFNNGLIDIVELRIIPYGNAHIHADGSLTCQVLFLSSWKLDIVTFSFP
jgi:interferon gamma-inducible protein 30